MDNPIESTNAPADTIKAKQKFTAKVLKTSLQGALVDIGSSLPAFIHISQVIIDNNPKASVKSIEEVLQVGQEVEMWVKRIRKDRIEMSMLEPLALDWRDLKVDMELTGKVVKLEAFGVFVEIGTERPGLVHISEMAHNYVRTPGELVKEGDEVNVKILELNKKKKQIKLSMKALQDVPEAEEKEEPRKQSKRGKGSRQVVEEVVQEEVIPDPTAMEIALRQAMEKQKKDRKLKIDSAMKNRKTAADYAEQDDIVERTLKNKVDSD